VKEIRRANIGNPFQRKSEPERPNL
jgi:hypothetical protein